MTDDRLSPLPLLASIALTATVLAVVIAWQATGVPIVALLLAPWLLVMLVLILPLGTTVGHDAAISSPARRRTVAAGMATAAVVAALTTAGDWSDTGDAESTSTVVLAAAAGSNSPADPTCDVLANASMGSRDR